MIHDELAALAAWLRRITVEVRSGGASHGAGVVWAPNGLIVTNAHVAAARPIEVRLHDGRAFSVRALRRDPFRDLALLQIDARGLAAAETSTDVRPGQLVVAVGHPLGLPGALSVGVVHAPPDGRSGAGPPARMLRADIRLAPGNSGGPLADVAGRVLGINTMIAQGLAYAIPSAAVERFVTEAWGDRAA